MTTTEGAPPGGGNADPGPQPELALTEEERFALIDGITTAFYRASDAERLLLAIRFPRAQWPNFDQNMTRAWNHVFADLENGILGSAPNRTILLSALRVYADHPTLRPLAERHGVVERSRPEPTPAPETQNAGTRLTCHVIVRADDEETRQYALTRLAALELAPQEVWSTGHAVSYRIATDDTEETRRRLEGSGLGWTLVAPGEPDYLYQQLFVEGPDARRFTVRGAPAQQTVGNLASEIVQSQYPRADGTTVPVTVDRVIGEGPETERIGGEDSLHAAGVRDGDTLRVGYQASAGSVHPDLHRAALERAHNQLRTFAEGRTDFRVRANTSRPPTEYEMRFRARSLGPGPHPGADPVEITDHVVLVVLGPEFPRQAPVLWWETPIFHPNVAPNYGDGLRRPAQAGMVCLGLLADEWQPGRDFGELCQMVVDMARFRNYGLFRETGEYDRDHRPVVVGDFYDKDAAAWVWRHQDYIRNHLGGVVKTAAPATTARFPNLIEPLP